MRGLLIGSSARATVAATFHPQSRRTPAPPAAPQLARGISLRSGEAWLGIQGLTVKPWAQGATKVKSVHFQTDPLPEKSIPTTCSMYYVKVIIARIRTSEK